MDFAKNTNGRQYALVLLPGLDGTGELFGPLLAELPTWIRPIVVSYPRDRQLAYAELLPLAASSLPEAESYVILGESFSGPLAVMLAAREPTGLRAVILCASFVKKPFRTLPAWLGAACVGPVFRLWPALLRLRSLWMSKELRALLKVDVEDQLRLLDLPLLYLQGRRDSLIRAHNLAGIRRIKPGLRVARIDTRHFLLQLEPKRAAEEIAAFLETLPIDLE